MPTGAEDAFRGRPIGRRLFIALLGAGAAGIALTKWAYGGDDATPGNVATSVPIGSMTPDEGREASEGVHPNIVPPERFRYYSVGDIPDFNERDWRLTVDGAGLDGSMQLRFAELTSFPNVAIKATFRCVTGWRVRDCIWRGVRLRDVIDANSPNRNAKHITFYAGDGVYTDSLTIGQARSDHAILAWELNGRPLIREQGYPLRLIYPDMYGYKNVKWLRRIEVKPVHDLGFWEQRGWDDNAYVYTPPSNG
ncbi:MAG TPA: molybdopterin-dependent oxidoreductase [Candidatus Dormibacteraeota bacterium]|nr:molybdopterin-dependent oxidoreductase [Candidatus Dormibacteraeota bacterium]